jgi:hypothetical protein
MFKCFKEHSLEAFSGEKCTNYLLFNDVISCVREPDSAVGMATGYGLGDRWVRVRVPEG